jgi:hypothetical protein
MAKKKAAPSTPCPNCGKPNHPRTKICGHCGKETKKATPKKKSNKKAAQPKPQATSLSAALKAERKTLQQRIDKIDDLLDSYH